MQSLIRSIFVLFLLGFLEKQGTFYKEALAFLFSS